MKAPLNRRDFLRVAGLLPLTLAAPRWTKMLGAPSEAGPSNVIIVVFDAFSAYNISLYGYSRPTTPNLDKLSKRAVVYHNHFASSNFTTSGTASLLTGTLPWTNRALRLNGIVAPPFVTRNLFSVFQDYYRIAYTHNGFANVLLQQFEHEMDELVPRTDLFLGSYSDFIDALFSSDDDAANVSWTRYADINQYGYTYSLFASHVLAALTRNNHADLRRLFPRGLPTTGDLGHDFLLEKATDWIGTQIAHLPKPFLGYFHLLPPHGPYNTELEFYNRFKDDGFTAMDKRQDAFTESISRENLLKRRTNYDEYILYVDREFGRFYDALEKSGMLENSWVVLTSDHGEMFERGISGHGTDALYEPVIRIPLLIFEPGREVGMEIHTPTSAVDVLPTLAHLTGHPIPQWAEGMLLPPYADGNTDLNRNIYVIKAAEIDQNAPLTRASTALVKGRYKLLYFFGYPEVGVNELVQLYDLQADPEELVDLSGSQKDVAAELLVELQSKLKDVNKPYM